MSDTIWVPDGAVYIVHDRQIARHGGGTRDYYKVHYSDP